METAVKPALLAARLLSLALALAAPFMARADVQYQFSGSWGGPENRFSQRFELTTPSYLTQDASFAAASLSACVSEILPCTAVHFVFEDINDPGRSLILFESQYATTYYYFMRNAFGRPGVHQMLFATEINPTTLTVIGPPVPEPGARLLVAFGLGLLALMYHLGSIHPMRPLAASRQRTG